ncbi:hypothetical protein FOE74_00325 [Rufibacter glacialis]|uniref:Uncharacterized protein n=1 Tax=Rufibacter glacialis TaxID=1259555 RepID=A0A5M8QSU6_9BACT|nr:hypothetical protein FOE74_00325 [Rufibacter glacialis]
MSVLFSASSWCKTSNLVLLAAFWMGATSCQDETIAPVMQSTHQAYDLVGFLDQEAQALQQQKAASHKTVSEAGAKKESKIIEALNWAEELAPFADADINKPALKGLFTQTESTNALGQQVLRYQAKEDAATNVQEVTYTLDSQDQLVRLQATIVQENMLFKTRKRMHLEARSGAPGRLTRYQLDEMQKLLLMEADHYSVTGEVVPGR